LFFSSKYFTKVGLYSNKFTNYLGCDSIVNINIQEIQNFSLCADATIYIPNAFSPNDDKTNNTFKPIGSNIKDIRMQIFNRWGEKIHEANGREVDWNGTYKNSICQESVYLYVINVEGINGKKYYFRGTLSILK